ALISGARAAVGIYVLTLIVFIIFETDLLRRPRKLIIVSSMAIFLLILNISLNDPLGVLESFQNSFENFMLRVEGSKEEGTVRIYKGFLDLFFKEFDYRFTGIGLGSTY